MVTHERLYRVEQDLAGVPIFLFGHRHGFKSTTFKGARFVNVSVLDNPVTVRPSTKTQCPLDDLRNINVGNYTVIEIDGDRIEATPLKFPAQFDGWTAIADGTVYGLPWLKGRNVEA